MGRTARRFGVVALGAAMVAVAVAASAGMPLPPALRAPPAALPANIIDGADDRDSLLVLGPELGLSAAEIGRIRRVSGYVGCLSPSPSMGTGALYLTDRHILTVAHIFFEREGGRRWNCFFKNQDEPSLRIDLLVDEARFGADRPKPGSNDDFAIVPLADAVPGAEPFPVAPDSPVRRGDALIVVTAHPAGMEKEVDNAIPVVQGCQVRRVPVSSRATSFYRTDCDATGSSSGGMHLSRVDGRLVFRGISITTGPWRDPAFRGAAYDEQRGSVTTALGADAGILKAGRALTGR